MGRQRPALRRLGDLPRQGLPRRPRPHLRLADQRLVRPGHPALRRRRRHVGHRGQRLHLRRGARQAPVVRRVAPRPGPSPASGTSSRRCPTPTPSTPVSRTLPCSSPSTAARSGPSCPGCASTTPARSGSRAPAGCACTRSSSDPTDADSLYVAISAAGAFRSDDGGKTWQPINKGLRSGEIPDTDAEVGHCVHRIAMHPSRPDVLFMQKHWDVMRSDDGGDSWHEVSGNLPTRLRLPDRRPRPRAGHHLRRPHQERLRALPARRQAARLPQPHRRQRVGGADEGPAAEGLLRQRPARRHGRRLARLLRRLLRHHRRPGLRLRRLRGQLGAHRPRPAAPCCPSRSRRCHDPRRAAAPPAHDRAGGGRGAPRRRRPGHAADGPRRPRAPLPHAARDDPRPRPPSSDGRSSGSSPARRTSRTSRPTPRSPTPSPQAPSPSW